LTRQAETAPSLPAATARALLAGFEVLGIPSGELRAAADIAVEDLAPIDGVLPAGAFAALWREAFRRLPHDELPTEVGLAIPFGAFGALDYLAASSATVAAAFDALASHFRYVATGFSLEIAEGADVAEVRIVPSFAYEGREIGDEFTLAVLAGRFRAALVTPAFRISEVRIARATPPRPTRHAALLGAPVRFGTAVSAMRVPIASWRAPLRTADPALQATLHALAERLDLGPASGDLELGVRARLRPLLREGRGEAAAVARALGVSERTLHRRLRDEGRTFREVLESFREAEAERLLTGGRVPLAELALQLGFSDQTAWNRAFRRWKGMSPTRWLEERRRPTSPPT
jgi:AraC-like DNA-binding protein